MEAESEQMQASSKTAKELLNHGTGYRLVLWRLPP